MDDVLRFFFFPERDFYWYVLEEHTQAQTQAFQGKIKNGVYTRTYLHTLSIGGEGWGGNGCVAQAI